MKDCSIFEADDNTLKGGLLDATIDLASYFFISQGHTPPDS